MEYACPYYRPSKEEKEILSKQILETIEKKGMTSFAKVFCEAHQDASYVLSPAELGIDRDMMDIFDKAQKEFHLNFLREHMANMDPKQVAKLIAFHYGMDIDKEVYAKIIKD